MGTSKVSTRGLALEPCQEVKVDLAAAIGKFEDHVVDIDLKHGHKHVLEESICALLEERRHNVSVLVELLPTKRLKLVCCGCVLPASVAIVSAGAFHGHHPEPPYVPDSEDEFESDYEEFREERQLRALEDEAALEAALAAITAEIV